MPDLPTEYWIAIGRGTKFENMGHMVDLLAGWTPQPLNLTRRLIQKLC